MMWGKEGIDRGYVERWEVRKFSGKVKGSETCKSSEDLFLLNLCLVATFRRNETDYRSH